MSRSENRMSKIKFLTDRLLYVLCLFIVIALACALFFLENARYPGFIDLGTISYFVALSFLLSGYGF